MVDRVANQIILPTEVKVTLVNGAFAVDLPATDDPDLSPTDLFYTVREVVAAQQRTYVLLLPYAGGAVDLADVMVTSVGPSPTYALLRLSALSDVSITGVADGNTLVYQGSTQTWVPGSPMPKAVSVGTVGGAIALSTTDGNLIQNLVTIPVSVTFPPSGWVLVTYAGRVTPTANNSQVLINLRLAGVSYAITELLALNETTGHKVAYAVLQGVPYVTAAYTVGGRYISGSGASIAANNSTAQPFVVSVTPLAAIVNQ